jgi:release factor glutamine methyltransferase
MKISELLKDAKQKLERPEDYLAVEVLLCYYLNREKEYLITNSNEELPAGIVGGFWTLFNRFYQGEPVAYLTNKKEFYGLDFFVDKRVLIPRPETELMVDLVLEYGKRMGGHLKVLDVGTGCGCIAVAVAKNCQDIEVLGVDISEEALDVAQKNLELNGVQSLVNLKRSDLLTDVDEYFDIIVANLPYIGEEKFNFVSKEAEKYEPHQALFGGTDGLRLYENLFEQIQVKMWKPKLLLGEFGFLQGESMRELLSKYFVQEEWEIRKDLASIERNFVVAFNPF